MPVVLAYERVGGDSGTALRAVPVAPPSLASVASSTGLCRANNESAQKLPLDLLTPIAEI
jgi:hypothetical protein